jgi:hypothetical protein
VLDEAREVFPDCVAPRDFDQIVVPLPEKGSPQLVPDGARRKAGPEGVSPEPAPDTAE